MNIDLHNHTKRCNHADGEPIEYIQKAIQEGIDVFGFSCHSPMNFDKDFRMNISECEAYERDILELKERFSGEIDILLAYETDFLPGYMEDRILNAKVDYLMGSVHFLNGWGVDNPESVFEYTRRNIDDVWFGYFLAIEQMAKSGKFDIVGHLDLVKIFNFQPTKDVRLIVENALKAIKQANMSVEINASGLRKPIKEQYPSRPILELLCELEVPITFGSDAHNTSHINFKKDELKALAREIGFTKCIYYKERDRIEVEL